MHLTVVFCFPLDLYMKCIPPMHLHNNSWYRFGKTLLLEVGWDWIRCEKYGRKGFIPILREANSREWNFYQIHIKICYIGWSVEVNRFVFFNLSVQVERKVPREGWTIVYLVQCTHGPDLLWLSVQNYLLLKSHWFVLSQNSLLFPFMLNRFFTFSPIKVKHFDLDLNFLFNLLHHFLQQNLCLYASLKMHTEQHCIT